MLLFRLRFCDGQKVLFGRMNSGKLFISWFPFPLSKYCVSFILMMKQHLSHMEGLTLFLFEGKQWTSHMATSKQADSPMGVLTRWKENWLGKLQCEPSCKTNKTNKRQNVWITCVIILCLLDHILHPQSYKECEDYLIAALLNPIQI